MLAKVLLIEDNAMNRQVVRDMFAVAGLEIDEASSGPEGLLLFEQGAYDLLLVDLRMPGMDGFEVMRTIRRRPDEKAATPIVVVSGETGPNLKADCLAAGADALITKPIAMEELFDTIGAVLAASARPEDMLF